MKILIIGGTMFLGRHLVEAALARGHTVTLFNRGQHNPDLFPEAEKLRGDRDSGLGALEGRRWDAVIDTCGYYPRIVRQSAKRLADAVGHYTFISSISAYADFRQPRMDESGPLAVMDRDEGERAASMTGETYGPLKVLCEQVVEEALPGRTLIVRPGMIVGPHDPSDRFTYWPARVARGGDVLVPGRPEQGFELIDVRDLAEWNVRAVEAGRTGAYNASGPDYPLTMQEVLAACRAVSGSDARFVYVNAAFLKAQDVEPETIHAWYIPEEEEQFRYVWNVSCDRAIADGLTYRPLADTIRDTLAWNADRPADREWRVGLTPEREQELLQAWEGYREGSTS